MSDDEKVPLSIRLVIILAGWWCIVQDVVYPATPALETVYTDVRLLAARNGADVSLEDVKKMMQQQNVARVIRGPVAPGVQVFEERVGVLGDVVSVLDLNGEEDRWKKVVVEVGQREDWLVLVLDCRRRREGGAVDNEEEEMSQPSVGLSVHGSGSQVGHHHPVQRQQQQQQQEASVVPSIHGSQRDASQANGPPSEHCGGQAVPAPSVCGSHRDVPPPSAHVSQAGGPPSEHGEEPVHVPSVHGSQASIHESNQQTLAPDSRGRRG